MAEVKSVKFNFIMNFILTASSLIFPLITFPYVSRILLPEGTGKVAFATSVIEYFTMVAMMGVPTYGIRACARVRNDKEKLSKTVQEIMIINLVMAMISYAAFFAALFHVEKFQQEKLLLLVSSSAILLNVIGVNWLYQALEQYSYITIRSLIFKVVGLLAMFMFVRQKGDYVIYGAITVFTASGSYILNFIRLKKYVSLKPILHYEFAAHIKAILVFFATTVAITIYTNLDTVMLGFMQGDEQVGLYNAAIKVRGILLKVVTALGTVLLPRLSYYYECGKKAEFEALIAKAISFVTLLATPLMVYFMFMSRESILVLSGGAYLAASIPMCILMPTILLAGMSNLTGIQVLIPTGKEKHVMISVMCGAVVDFTINLFLIPNLASSGAAIGTLIAEIIVLVIQVWVLKDILRGILGKIKLHYTALAIVPAVGVLILFKMIFKIEHPFVSLAVTAVIYFGIYGIALLGMKEPIIYSTYLSIIEKMKGKRR